MVVTGQWRESQSERKGAVFGEPEDRPFRMRRALEGRTGSRTGDDSRRWKPKLLD